MKTTTEVLVEIGNGIDRQALYYMERKGYLAPHIKRFGRITRRDHRQWDDAQIALAGAIWSFRKQGYEWSAAYEKALDATKQPPMFK